MTYMMAPDSPRWRPWQERFFARVVFDGSSCWLWSGAKNGDGYGLMDFGNAHPNDAPMAAEPRRDRMERAHRVAYTVFRGAPVNECLMHSCDQPLCVNPWHLTDATRSANIKDMWAKGRQGNPTRRPLRGEASPHSKLTEADVRRIRELLAAGMSYRRVGAEVGCGWSAVREVAAGRTWRHVA
jgi:hypothetical protein